jgi:hypothetical protein
MLPEYLHKDELQYELEVRGVPTAGLDVAALRSAFRKSRHLKEDPLLLGNTHLLLDHEAVLAFFQDRYNQIKDLVENTDACRISADFPRYVHRLRHLANRLGHLLQYENLGAQLQSSTQKLERELSAIVEYVTNQLRAAETMPPVPVIEPDAYPSVDFQGRPNLVTDTATFPLTDTLRAPSGHADLENPRVDRSLITSYHAPSSLLGSHGSTYATPFAFAKLPNPVRKLLVDLRVADGLEVGTLLKWLRVLIRMRDMSVGSGAFHTQILHILYGFTKGALASRTLAAIHRGDTLDVYHRDVLAFFIPPRVMTPLLLFEYFRHQRPGESLAAYVTDIREMAVVLRQDEDERSVVQVIIEGLHPRERNRLVFCDKPRTYEDLDMCVYARNIAYGDEGYSGERPPPHSTRSTASPAAPPSVRVPPVCYFCHKLGHIRRDCRARAAAATPQAPASSRQAPGIAALSPVSSIRSSTRNCASSRS